MIQRPVLALALVLSWSCVAAAQTAFLTVGGDSTADRLGTSVAAAGDIDQDGFLDFIVGAPGVDSGASNAGAVRVFSGRDGSILLSLSGSASDEGMGTFVTAVGDVDGDGVPDLFAGSPLADLAGDQSGVARVLSGKTGALLFRFDGHAQDDSVGIAATAAGDLDLDGFADFAIGVPGQRTVEIHSGKTGTLLTSFTNDVSSFGSALAVAGDLDGDGVLDLIVGAPFPGHNASGHTIVVSGGTGAKLFEVKGRTANDGFGRSVSRASDVNGDGVPDLIVGAPVFYATAPGYAEVYSGKDASRLASFEGDQATDDFGISVSDAGDLDQDGFGDLMVGDRFDDPDGRRPGSAWVFSGRNGSVLYSVSGGRLDELGTSVSHAGDVNGDGIPDLVVGSPAGARNGHSLAGLATLFSGQTYAPKQLGYGSGWPGTLGVPSFAASAEPIICSTIGLELGNSRGRDTQATVFAGASPAELPTAYGGTLLVLPLFAFPTTLPAAGASVPVTIPCDVSVCGTEVFLQSIVVDPGASQGIAFSRGLMLVLGGTPSG